VSAAPRLARQYAWLLGGALFLEGALMLIVGTAAPAGLPFATTDVRHNLLHVAWGGAMLVLMLISARLAPLVLVVFGVFYVALAFAGILVTNPLGLQLGPGENAFHFIVGPLALALGLAAFTARRSGLRLARS
jgi:predicted membrane channel-forming protein YqfA (hemolysin III family)